VQTTEQDGWSGFDRSPANPDLQHTTLAARLTLMAKAHTLELGDSAESIFYSI